MLMVMESVADPHADVVLVRESERVGEMEVVRELDWVLLRVEQVLTDPVAV